jgi:hypothetical protein
MARKQWLSVGDLTLEGYTNADGATVYADNAPNQYAIFCGKAGAPSNSWVAYYMTGCLYINLTNGALYYNAGTTPGTASWSSIGSIAGGGVSTTMLAANAVTPVKLGTRTLVGLSNGNATPTIAQLMTSSVFTMTPTAARTFTTPAAATIVAGITGATVGSWFDFTIVNLSATTAAYGITLTAGDASVTLVGSPVVYSGSGTFRAVLTNVTGAAEALSIYRMDDAVPAVLTGITPGTQAASKAVVADANVNTGVAKVTALHIGASGSETQVTASAAEINTLASVTAGTTSPSKAVVLDAAESLAWATTDSTASETCTLTITDTRTGAGATGWAAKFDLEANVALGSYANGCYGYLALGASGKVTGLGAGVCSETVLSSGCTDGTYAGLEIELGMPSGALTGTATSFIYCSLYGADAATFDTNGYFFTVTGVTKNTGKVYQSATTGSTARPTEVLKVHTPDGIRYLPLYSTVACAA